MDLCLDGPVEWLLLSFVALVLAGSRDKTCTAVVRWSEIRVAGSGAGFQGEIRTMTFAVTSSNMRHQKSIHDSKYWQVAGEITPPGVHSLNTCHMHDLWHQSLTR